MTTLILEMFVPQDGRVELVLLFRRSIEGSERLSLTFTTSIEVNSYVDGVLRTSEAAHRIFIASRAAANY